MMKVLRCSSKEHVNIWSKPNGFVPVSTVGPNEFMLCLGSNGAYWKVLTAGGIVAYIHSFWVEAV